VFKTMVHFSSMCMLLKREDLQTLEKRAVTVKEIQSTSHCVSVFINVYAGILQLLGFYSIIQLPQPVLENDLLLRVVLYVDPE